MNKEYICHNPCPWGPTPQSQTFFKSGDRVWHHECPNKHFHPAIEPQPESPPVPEIIPDPAIEPQPESPPVPEEKKESTTKPKSQRRVIRRKRTPKPKV